jgi:nucleoside-diphosphate-sugar epimerase
MQKGKTIGVVGLGWLGEALAIHLKQAGHTLWGTTRSDEKQARIEELGIAVYLWTNTNDFSEAFTNALSTTDFLVLNLPPSVFKDNTYAEGLFSIVKQLSSNCKVIYTSSSGVYPAHLVDATEDYVFQDEESNKLLEAEQVLAEELKERLCILRLAGLIGEDRNPVTYLAKKEINDEPDKKVNLIHRKDILRIVTQIIAENHFGEIFNVCHPEHPTRKAYYSRIAQQYNLGEIRFSKNITELPSRAVNCRKLQNKLSYPIFEPLFE